MTVHPSTRARFRKAVPLILTWYRSNQRSFIWRGVERTPYEVLVSELMLQQTGARYVEKRLPVFLKQFPSVVRLASAPRADVLKAWQGLGYNRRALQLHHAAKAIATAGRFPDTLEGLQALPGVGRYTASAVLAFAHNVDVSVVDVNIERVLSRMWKWNVKIPIREIYELDAAIMPMGNSSEWHQALMDLGSVICSKRAPKCAVCPVRMRCKSAGKISKTIPATTAEKRYWGEPRRVWRGRILSTITQATSVSHRRLVSNLRTQYGIKDSIFVPFVRSIIKLLQTEGFISIHRGSYSLSHE